MRKLAISACVAMVFCFLTLSAAFADSSLQDAELNINNGTPFSGPSAVLSAPGVNASGFNSTTGQGTIIVTVLGSSCGSTCNVDLWLFTPVSVPFYNEYGATSGSATSTATMTQSWQIDVPDYDADGNTPAGGGSGIANTDANSLANTNFVPGTLDDYLGGCGAGVTAPSGNPANGNCNDAVSLALGMTFSNPGSGNEEILTFTVGSSCQAGSICLEDVHPVDGNNTTQADLFYSATGTVCSTGPTCTVIPPPPPGMPEPATLLMLGTSLLGLAGLRRRL